MSGPELMNTFLNAQELLGKKVEGAVARSFGNEIPDEHVKKLIKDLKEFPETIENFNGRIFDDLGPQLVMIGICYGHLASMGQLPKLVGKNLSVLEKRHPLTVERGMNSLMDTVRGDIVWKETEDKAAQRKRHDALHIILGALSQASVDEKTPGWVNEELVEFVLEMFAFPYAKDLYLIEDITNRMAGPYGLHHEEIAEKQSLLACETVEVLLALNPHLRPGAERTAEHLEFIVEHEDFKHKITYPVAVSALECARNSIALAAELPPVVAKNRLKQSTRALAGISMLI